MRLTTTKDEYLDTVLAEEERRLQVLEGRLKVEYGEELPDPLTEVTLSRFARDRHGMGPLLGEYLNILSHVNSLRDQAAR